MGLLARSFIGALVTSTTFLIACGHSAFDPLPSSDQGLTDDGGRASEAGPTGVDGGPIHDGGEIDDGGIEGADGSPPIDGGGRVDAGCTDCAVYVSALAGVDTDDASAGSMAAPFKTISVGIRRAGARGVSDVRIANGSYNENVTVQEGVSLHGGYTCSALPCPWTAPAASTATNITSQQLLGVVVPATVTRATTIANLSITSVESPIDQTGNLIRAAMTITGAPMVSYCTITATASSGDTSNVEARSVGLVIAGSGGDGKGALVDHCTITAAGAPTASVGVLFDVGTTDQTDALADAVIQYSMIASGDASQSVGVLANATSTAQLLQNTITSGASTGGAGSSWGVMANTPLVIDSNTINLGTNAPVSCTTTSSFCGGITTMTPHATIVNNWVFGAAASRSAAVMINYPQSVAAGTPNIIVDSNTLNGGGSDGGFNANAPSSISAAIVLSNAVGNGNTPVIASVANNILLGGTGTDSYGIYENPLSSTARCTTLDTNDFFLSPNFAGGSTAFYHVWNPVPGMASDITTTEGLASSLPSPPHPKGNINGDPELTGYTIASSSPCVDQGSTSSNSPLLDITGRKRPQGKAPDIGAYELPQP